MASIRSPCRGILIPASLIHAGSSRSSRCLVLFGCSFTSLYISKPPLLSFLVRGLLSRMLSLEYLTVLAQSFLLGSFMLLSPMFLLSFLRCGEGGLRCIGDVLARAGIIAIDRLNCRRHRRLMRCTCCIQASSRRGSSRQDAGLEEAACAKDAQ